MMFVKESKKPLWIPPEERIDEAAMVGWEHGSVPAQIVMHPNRNIAVLTVNGNSFVIGSADLQAGRTLIDQARLYLNSVNPREVD